MDTPPLRRNSRRVLSLLTKDGGMGDPLLPRGRPRPYHSLNIPFDAGSETSEDSMALPPLDPAWAAHDGDAETVEESRFKAAVKMVKDSLEGITPSEAMDSKPEWSNKFKALGRTWWYPWAMRCVILVLLGLVGWEPARTHSTRGNSGVAMGCVEGVCITVLIGDVARVVLGYGWHTFIEKKWSGAFVVVLAACFLDFVLEYPAGAHVFRFSRPLRPILLIAQSRDLRRMLATMLVTFVNLVDIFVLLAIFILFFSVMATQLFNSNQVAGYSPTNDNFDSLGSSALAVYILSTTENFPSVMYPSLDHRPILAVLFFATCLFMFLWLLLPLLLAIVYNRYRDSHKARIQQARVKTYVGLISAWRLLMDREDNTMHFSLFDKLVAAIAPYRTASDRLMMFGAIDDDLSHTIAVKEFLQLPSVLRLRFKPEVLPSQATSGFTVWASAAVLAPWFKWFTRACIVGSTVPALFWNVDFQQRYNMCRVTKTYWQCSGEVTSVLDFLCTAFLAGSLFELVVRIGGHPLGEAKATPWVLVWKWLGHTAWNTFDTLVVLWSFTASLLLALGVKHVVSAGWSDVLEVTRAVRVLRLLVLHPRLQRQLEHLSSVIVAALQYLIVYESITYSFAVVGMELFGGVNPHLPGTSDNRYTFESFGEASLQLFQLTVGNNWNEVMYPNVNSFSRWAAWFFVAYYVCCTDILVTIITSVVIDAHEMLQEVRGKQEEQERTAEEGLLSRPSVGDHVPLQAMESKLSVASPEDAPLPALTQMAPDRSKTPPRKRLLTEMLSVELNEDLAVANGANILSREELAMLSEALDRQDIRRSTSSRRG